MTKDCKICVIGKVALCVVTVFVFSVGFIGSTFASAVSSIDDVSAYYLNKLGLFSGVGFYEDGAINFDLERSPNRMEAVTMLIRLLGKETEANNANWETPFTDVEDWAKPYVGYAYENGLTSGTSATTFGSSDAVSGTQYMTFLLRALGYNSDSDFSWDKAWELTNELWITSGQYDGYNDLQHNFTRGDVAIVSYRALGVRIKDGSQTLLEHLGYTDSTVPLSSSDTFTKAGYCTIKYGRLFFEAVDMIELDSSETVGYIELSEQFIDSVGTIYEISQIGIVVECELTNDTTYSYFVGDEYGDRKHTVSDKGEFAQHLDTAYSDLSPTQAVPFIVEVRDGKVISVVEEYRLMN